MRFTEDFPRNSRGMIDFFRKFYKVLTYTAATQPAFTCSKLTIEILEQGVKYVQS